MITQPSSSLLTVLFQDVIHKLTPVHANTLRRRPPPHPPPPTSLLLTVLFLHVIHKVDPSPCQHTEKASSPPPPTSFLLTVLILPHSCLLFFFCTWYTKLTPVHANTLRRWPPPPPPPPHSCLLFFSCTWYTKLIPSIPTHWEGDAVLHPRVKLLPTQLSDFPALACVCCAFGPDQHSPCAKIMNNIIKYKPLGVELLAFSGFVPQLIVTETKQVLKTWSYFPSCFTKLKTYVLTWNLTKHLFYSFLLDIRWVQQT